MSNSVFVQFVGCGVEQNRRDNCEILGFDETPGSGNVTRVL